MTPVWVFGRGADKANDRAGDRTRNRDVHAWNLS